MGQLEISIVKLQDELKQANNNILSLLKERDAIKKAYSMQIDLVQALEKGINDREKYIQALKNKLTELETNIDCSIK